MTAADAASLLIAVGGSDSAKHASRAITRFGQMHGTIYDFRCEPLVRRWLSPLGIRKTKPDLTLRADFKSALEFLIEQAGNGELYRFLDSIPSATTRGEYLRKYAGAEGEILLSSRRKEIVARGVEKYLERRPATLTVQLDRSKPAATIRIERWWGVPESVARVDFYLDDRHRAIDENNFPSDFSVKAEFSEATLAIIGLRLRDADLPYGTSVESFDFRKLVPEYGASCVRPPIRKPWRPKVSR